MADRRRITHLVRGETHSRGDGCDDAEIGDLAGRQDGIVARAQLRELGLSERVIDRRLGIGWLRPIHAGVYAVGHDAVTARGRLVGAILATSPGSVASHASAAWLLGLLERPPPVPHVTATALRAPRPGLVIHRASLAKPELTIIAGIPATGASRTLLDLSAECGGRELRRLVKEAEFRRLADTASLAAMLDRHPRRRGRRPLARLVADRALTAGKTRSELEDRFLLFCRRRGLPLPETNVELAERGRTLNVDCVWRSARVVLELDGRRGHDTATAFEAASTRVGLPTREVGDPTRISSVATRALGAATRSRTGGRRRTCRGTRGSGGAGRRSRRGRP